MAQHDFLFDHHLVVGLYPVADAFAGGVASDVVSLKNYRRATFFVITGAIEDSGISNVVTIEACDDVVPTTTTAMAFRSRVIPSSTTVDQPAAMASRAAAGHNFALANAVANAVWVAEVTADEVEAAAPGSAFVRLKVAETVNKTITATCIVILSEPRYPQAIPLSAIA